MKNIRFVPLDDSGNPILNLSTPTKAVDFNFDEPEDDDLNWSSMGRVTTEWSTEFKMDQTTFDLLAGTLPEPRWILESQDHKLEIWNIREGERQPDGRIPYTFDGRFLCGPHDLEGNHLNDASRMTEGISPSPSE